MRITQLRCRPRSCLTRTHLTGRANSHRAVVVLSKVISDGAERAERKRERKSREEYAGIGHDNTDNSTVMEQP